MLFSCIDYVKKNIAPVIFFVLLGLLSLYLFTFHNVRFDEGVVLNMAWQMWQGKKLYVDFFEYLPPGSSFFILILWKIFGQPSYLIAAVFSWVFWFISAVCLYFFVLLLLKENIFRYCIVVGWLILSCLYPAINHNSHSAYLSVVLLYFTYRFLLRPNNILLLIIGSLSGFLIFFLHTKGIVLYILISIFIFFNIGKKRIFFSFLYILVCLFVTLFLFSRWNINDLVQNLIVFPWQAKYVETSYFISETIFMEIAIVLLMFGITSVVWKKEFWLLTLFQVGLFLGGIYNIDIFHLALLIFPFLIFCFLVVVYIFDYQKVSQQNQLKIGYGCFGLLIIVVVSMLYFSDKSHHVLQVDVLKNTRLLVMDNDMISRAKNIYAGPFMPGLYFELRKPNPFIYTHNMLYCQGECQDRTVEILKRVRPEYAIMGYYYMPKVYNIDNPVDNYIKNEYEYCGRSSQYLDIYALDGCPGLF